MPGTGAWPFGSGAELAGDGGVDLGAALGTRQVDPLLDGVGALARRAEDDRGDAGRGEERRVGPEGDTAPVGPAGAGRAVLPEARRPRSRARGDPGASCPSTPISCMPTVASRCASSEPYILETDAS